MTSLAQRLSAAAIFRDTTIIYSSVPLSEAQPFSQLYGRVRPSTDSSRLQSPHNRTTQGQYSYSKGNSCGKVSSIMAPHPFKTLGIEETRIARDVILSLHPDSVVDFREIFLKEPNKELMKAYLELEHAAQPGQSPDSKRPPRLAKCQYDVVGSDKVPEYHESVVDVGTKKRVRHEVIGKEFHASLTLWEFEHLVKACDESDEFKKAIAEFNLPEGFELVIEPW